MQGVASVTQKPGHGAKVVTSLDVTAGIAGAGYRATLYVLAFGAIAGGLTYTLQDSEDNVNWATVSAVVNGVDAQHVIVTGVADTPQTVLVKHSAIRRYHRLLPQEGPPPIVGEPPGPGPNDNFCSVVALLVGPDQEIDGNVDFQVGV